MSSNIVYMAEILLAELIFLYPAERRPHFPLRYAAAWLLPMLFVVLLPTERAIRAMPSLEQPIQFIRFILMLTFSIAAMGFSFKLSWPAVTASCAAGYAVQHIAFHIAKLLCAAGFLAGLSVSPLAWRKLVELCVFPPVYFLFWLTIGRMAGRNRYYKRADRRFDLLSISIVVICVGLTRVAKCFGDGDSVTVSLYAITACFMALMVQLVLSGAVNLEHEQKTMELLWQEDRKHYELSKKTIDTINIKYHDLKHKLQGLAGQLPAEEIESIQEAVRVYGGQFKTGSETLDVLLTTYSLQCGAEGIALTYTGRGGDLSFMRPMDIYSLFGNAVSNAVEAVQRVDDPEKRVIDIISQRMGDMVSISISNFFSGTRRMEDGLPVTTKTEEEGFHGYGMKSMRLIAEKYGGSLTAAVDQDLFNLNIYLMEG